MFKKIIAGLLVMAMMVGITACQTKEQRMAELDKELAEQIPTLSGTEVSEMEEEESEESSREVQRATPAAISDDFADLEFSLEGEAYKLPLKVSTLLDKGWEITDYNGNKLEDKSLFYQEYASYGYLTNERSQISVSIKNYSMDSQPLSKSYIYSIQFSLPGAFSETVTPDVVFAKGISFDSTPEEIKSAYEEYISEHEPNATNLYYTFKAVLEAEDEFEGEDEEITTGEAHISLDYDALDDDKKPTGLSDVTLQSSLDATDVIEPLIPEGIPEMVKTYEKATEVGKSIESCTISIDGSIYAFPVPVNVLIEDGWSLKQVSYFNEAEDNTAETVQALFPSGARLSLSSLEIERNGQVYIISMVNPDKLAQPVKYCFVEGFSTKGDGYKYELPGGIKNGDTQQAVVDAYGKSEEDGDYNMTYSAEPRISLRLSMTDGLVDGFAYDYYMDLNGEDEQ